MSAQPPTRGHIGLTRALAAALGLPKGTQRAVLTLEAGKPPTLHLTVLATDTNGRPIIEEALGEYGEGVERRLAQVQFMVRLAPFPDLPQTNTPGGRKA